MRSWAERQFRKREQQSEGEKAYAEYRSKQAATLTNMQRLRSLRQSRDKKRAAAPSV
jgi:hypothetical protein